MSTRIKEVEYMEASEGCLGWCTECCEFTRENTEPDAESCDCPKCGSYTVIGADNALIMGLLDF